MKRAVHIFPNTSSYPEIEAFRARYDSLSRFVDAHITLVFPFDSSITDEKLIHHVSQQASRIKAFTFSAGLPVFSSDDHYWLPIQPIAPELLTISQLLNTKPLAEDSSGERDYHPHITISRPPLSLDVESEFLKLPLSFPLQLEAKSIVIERIMDDESSQIIKQIILTPRNEEAEQGGDGDAEEAV